MRNLTSFIFLIFCCSSFAQPVYQPLGSSVYSFLDEMAHLQLIDWNDAVQPMSRNQIHEYLEQIGEFPDELNQRQKKELAFYQEDFFKNDFSEKSERRKDAFYRKENDFDITLNPILSGKIITNKKDEIIQRKVGAYFFGSFSERFGYYAELTDFNTSEITAAPTSLNLEPGGNFKIDQGELAGESRADYSEMKASLHYEWEWGSFGITKDRFTWGSANHGSNIFSDKAPSFFFLDLRVSPTKWLDFKYIHAWLNSEVLDSARTYLAPNGSRKIFFNKNLAANFFTVKPFDFFHFSFGNSIVYSDNGLEPVYFIPFMFFKSLDHDRAAAGSNELGQNSQLFFNTSYYGLKKIHIYSSLYLDDVNFGNMFDPDLHTNLFSWKIGASAFPMPDVKLIAEYTRNNPWTYGHQIETTTFASNQYNLGHYLGENAQEIFLGLEVKPIPNLICKVNYTFAQKGPQHEFSIIAGNANTQGLVFLEEIIWENQSVDFIASYEWINDVKLELQYNYNKSTDSLFYLNPFYQGTNHTVQLGVTVDF